MPDSDLDPGSPEREIWAIELPREAAALAKDARRAGLEDVAAEAEWCARSRAWGLVEANYPVAIDYINRRMTWVIENGGLFDDAIQIARLLMFRAAMKWDPSQTTYAGWAIATLQAQLLIRLRETQGLYGPDGNPSSLDEVMGGAEDDGSQMTRGDTIAAPQPQSEDEDAEDRRRHLARIRSLVSMARRTSVSRRYPNSRAQWAIARWICVRAFSLGEARVKAAARIARRHGITVSDLLAAEAEWRQRSVAAFDVERRSFRAREC